MNKKIIFSSLLVVVIFSISVFAYKWFETKNLDSRKNTSDITQESKKTFSHRESVSKDYNIQITEDIKSWLILMREEEKLARDIYLQLYETYKLRSFFNIAKSEQQHMDAIKTILDKYNIEDPITNNEVGLFTNQELQKLYDELLSKWKQSISDWVQVWIDIEKIDINDLERLLEDLETWSDLYNVYKSLLRWSKNHLKAFERQLQRL